MILNNFIKTVNDHLNTRLNKRIITIINNKDLQVKNINYHTSIKNLNLFQTNNETRYLCDNNILLNLNHTRNNFLKTY